MFYLYVTAPGMAARKVSLDRPVTTIGRSSMNDLPISDKMLSRQHSRIVRTGDGGFTVEDLGSRNGTFLNGERLTTVQVLKPGDRITVGGVTLKVESESTTRVRIEGGGEDPLDNTILKASAELLRAHATETDPRLPAEQLGKLIESLRVVNELTVELLRDISVDELLGFLMDKVFETLKPDRGLVLLKSRATGELVPAVVRVAEGISAEDIRLSKTLVAAVVEKRNGLLLMDTMTGSGVSLADSIRLSGIKSVLAAPLENAGEVVGLIYVDCRVGHRSFEEADLRLLTSLANVAAAKIQNARLMEENAEKRQMDREFALAREIQQRLLPEDPPPLPGWELHGSNVASRQVSGDYFDFRLRPDGKIYATIADVCGKGVGPALLMASLQASFHAWADEGVPVAEMTGRLSEAISRRTGPDRFITFFLLLLDPATGEVEYTNAGHNPGILLRANGSLEELGSHGLPLALFPGKPYGSAKLTLARNDLLLLYTDGVTEANDPEGTEFGMPRLKEFVGAQLGKAAADVEKSLGEALEGHAKGEPYADDRTLVMVRRLPA
ncbi:MAG TPA: SpoIIE family protein phosphatase [Thermoanaerobaculia bacterium]|nr:SpoIIE family protein phosphatase [Thermoanaerobaculia bacterium]